MPELPEVETTRRGISPFVEAQVVTQVIVRESRMRWPIPGDLADKLIGQCINRVSRRGKYLILDTDIGSVLIHLGMSGSLRVVDPASSPRKHDHVDMVLANGHCLRLHDPRRFGCVLWCDDDPLGHPLLCQLGPEPLGEDFSGGYLYQRSRQRKMAIKSFLMDSHVVVGVGNIYASESLFMAGIAPKRAAGRVSLQRYTQLAECVREVLHKAIEKGGTTLRDFVGSQGEPGYFQQELLVYGRDNQPCRHCGANLILTQIGQRASVYCRRCQT
ncbi:MAG TPA: bifunctional DNA-formamidopyrimidine glycosylase/DNA-(apurinic or apyrimidinic site) lyase [Chromatiaceae bacterium]|jgi:formamidopyrimidine-DNA glycosylase|nr:bifunctional DNA-formamidopyrimidine glycosylase/DNA-(apurinic or apyrimidinic site) lyase [Chromatiaceae bacterium]